MGVDTKIEWCHHTANPWWGCTKVSDGCKHCYAETFSKRTGHNVWGPKASRRMMKSVWHEVRKWAVAAAAAGERRRVFTGSMMDFAEDRPDLVEPRKRFCGIIEELEDLDFLILTKRPENYNRLMPWDAWPPNAWAGASAENQKTLGDRILELQHVHAPIHWLSCEPLLTALDFGIWLKIGLCDWVVVGGESGGGARRFDIEWARTIIRQCKNAGTACFVKQLGATPYEFTVDDGHQRIILKDRKGGDMSEWPEDLRVREFPETARV